jgi:hypothetical protein
VAGFFIAKRNHYMLMQQQLRDVQTYGFESVQSYRVRVNARLFKAMIDDPYSNKMAAAIREPATNGFDAHRRAGTPDRPLEVKLPSELDPVFRVRDFGPSLDHESVLELYCTLNASDKTTSNDEVGGFGIGAKAPFAYVSSFSVTTWQDGQCQLYSCFVGPDGVPQIASTKPVPSDEPNGLEVSFSVPRPDIQKFRATAGEILSAFEPLPIILNEGFKIPLPEIVASGDGWRLEKREGGPRARMGSVFYPVDINQTYGYCGQPKCAHANVTIDAPIGALSITNSRESLGYDQKTITFIKAKLGEVDQHLWAECQRQIEAQPTYPRACVFLTDQIKGPDGRLWKDDNKKFTWKSRAVTWGTLYTRKFQTLRLSPITCMQGRRRYADKKWKHSQGRFKSENVYSIPVDRLPQLLILLESPDLDQVSRRKNVAIAQNEDRHLLWVKGASLEFHQLLEDLADPEWQSLADYEPIHPVRSGQPSRYKGVSMPTRSVDYCHVYSPMALPESGIYVEMAGKNVRCFGQEYDPEYLREIIKEAINIGAIPEDTRAWLFNGRHKSRRVGWQSLETVITAWMKAHFDPKAYKLEAQKKRFASGRMASFLHTVWEKYPAKSNHRLSRFAKQIGGILQSGFHTSRSLEATYERCFPGEFDKIELKPLKLEAELGELLKRWPFFEILEHQDEETLTLHYLSLI